MDATMMHEPLGTATSCARLSLANSVSTCGMCGVSTTSVRFSARRITIAMRERSSSSCLLRPVLRLDSLVATADASRSARRNASSSDLARSPACS